MIRKLTEQDRATAMEFLGREAALNLFAIGDMEAFGFDSDFKEFWGQYDSKGELEGILLRFNESYIPYLKDLEVDHQGFQEIIGQATGKIMLSGKEEILKKFLPEKEELRTTYFCELTQVDRLEKETDLEIKVAEEKDAERLAEMIEKIVEFQGVANTPDRIAHKIRTNTGRVYFVEDEKGEIISCSQTSAENSKSAMVVGVATLPEYRGKGIMSRCLSKLCRDLLSEGRTLCLFYDNPKAGSVYHRLGFESIGKWVMESREQ